MPKSVTFTGACGGTSTFAGLMSRCTIPLRWAWSSAAVTPARDAQALVDGQRTALVEEVPEVRALDELHDQVGDAVVLAGVVGGDDVGVGEAGDGHCLVAEPRPGVVVVREIGVERLHRDPAGEEGVVADPDAGHAAPREQRLEVVAATERATGRGGVRHRATVPASWSRYAGHHRGASLRYERGPGWTWKLTPITPGPACVPMTGPTMPVTISSRGLIGVEQVEELLEVVGLPVEHGQRVDRLGRDLLGQHLERLRARPHLARLLHDAVADLDDGLDGEHRAQERTGVADPTSLLQVLERVERPEETGAVAAADHLVDDPVEGVTVGRAAGRGEAERPEPHGDGERVDDVDRALLADRRGCDLRGLHGRREARREVDADDPGGAAGDQVAVAGLERAGGRRRGLGQVLGGLEPVPERVGGQLFPVDELLVAEADREWHDLDPERVDEVLRQVARAVGDDSNSHGSSSWARAAGCPPLLMVSWCRTRRRGRHRPAGAPEEAGPSRARSAGGTAGAGRAP